MAEYTATDIAVAPYFDLELLMDTCQEARIDGAVMEKLADAWDRWLPLVKARRIQCGNESYLLVWLLESVEEDVDEKWEQAPSEAFIFNALAQVLCMGVTHALLPQVEDLGCAPVPRPTNMLGAALEAERVPYLVMGEPGLARRYAVVTHYPFRGGCEICMLQEQCPKNGGMTVTLPGYE